MKFAKKFKELSVPPSVKYHLHKAMASYEEARPITRTHASDITRQDPLWCPRETALLMATKKKPKGQFIGTSLRYTFDIGWALHEYINMHWLRDRAIGDWKCLGCGTKFKFQKRPKKCTTCNGLHFKHYEVGVYSKQCGVVGGIDLIVDIDEPRYRMVEVKTIDKDAFKTLVAPLAEHRLRTNLYMRLAAESGYPEFDKLNVQEAFVLYMVKGYGVKDDQPKKWGIPDSPFSPFKEYVVTRDDAETEPYVELARRLDIFKNTKKMPHGICDTSFCKRAQTCSMVKECWSGQFPAGV